MEKDTQKKLSSDEADISVHDGHLQYAASPRPEALQHLSEDELKQLETRLRRKIDIRLLPSMILIYIMNYLDRYDTVPRTLPEKYTHTRLLETQSEPLDSEA